MNLHLPLGAHLIPPISPPSSSSSSNTTSLDHHPKEEEAEHRGRPRDGHRLRFPHAQGRFPLVPPRRRPQGPLRLPPQAVPLQEKVLPRRQSHPSREAYVPSDPTHQRRPLHRQPRDADHVQPPHCVVPLQPPRLPYRREPAAPRHRGRPRARLPPRWAVREDRPAQRHRRRRCRRIAGSCRSGGDPQHLPEHVRGRVVRRGRAVDRAIVDAHRPEEGG